jgi:seryl-tRNA synthetase
MTEVHKKNIPWWLILPATGVVATVFVYQSFIIPIKDTKLEEFEGRAAKQNATISRQQKRISQLEKLIVAAKDQKKEKSKTDENKNYEKVISGLEEGKVATASRQNKLVKQIRELTYKHTTLKHKLNEKEKEIKALAKKLETVQAERATPVNSDPVIAENVVIGKNQAWKGLNGLVVIGVKFGWPASAYIRGSIVRGKKSVEVGDQIIFVIGLRKHVVNIDRISYRDKTVTLSIYRVTSGFPKPSEE